MPTKGTVNSAKTPRLKNYTSQASESAIFEAIRKTLAAHKAKRIVFDYDDAGRAAAIEFTIELLNTRWQYRLPARFDDALPLVAQARKAARMGASSGQALRDQAYRTVWATIRDWVDAQMALIDIGASSLEETFLPYLITDSGKTLFEDFAERRALPAPGRTVITEE